MIINYDNSGFRSIVTTIGNGFRSIITTQDLDFRQIIVVTSTGGGWTCELK